MLFYIGIILIAALYFAVLELSKNILISFAIGIIAVAAMIGLRIYLKKKNLLTV